MRSRTRLANDAWEALLSAHATLIKEFAADHVWQGLSMREYDVLYTLSKCRGPVRMSELNRHVLLSQPALSRMVDRLVDRGLISRCADPADGRGVQLALTDEGRVTQRRVGSRHALSVAHTVGEELEARELLELERICRKLARQPAAAGTRGLHEDIRS